jgi:hypothetical protein
MRRQLVLSSLPVWLAFLGPLAIYVASLSPAVAYWDTGEEQTVPTILGIAHPTGFPLFVLAGWLFAHGVVLQTPAWRIGLMSAVAMALAARNVAVLVRSFDVDACVAAAAALVFALGNVAWSRGSRAEVHALAIMFETFALLAAVRFHRSGRRSALRWCVLALGLSLATHTVTALVVPGLALIAAKQWRTIDLPLALQSFGILALCGSLYLYLPLRSAAVSAARLDPTLSIGVPPGRPFWDYDHPASLAGFVREVFGGDFDVDDGLRAIVSVGQYPSELLRFVRLAVAETGPIAFGAGVVGLGFVLREEPWLGAGLLVTAGLIVPFATNYRALADIDRWFLLAYWLVCACAAIGVARVMPAYLQERSALATALSGLVLGALAFGLLRDNASIFAQRSSPQAEPFVERVLKNTPPNAIVVAYWTFATPLAYAAFVQHRLAGRIVETQWIEDDARYLPRWVGPGKRPVIAVADRMPHVAGFRFMPVGASGLPMLLRVTR